MRSEPQRDNSEPTSNFTLALRLGVPVGCCLGNFSARLTVVFTELRMRLRLEGTAKTLSELYTLSVNILAINLTLWFF